ncbi:metal ABC transporter ATP-binding protein [Oscillospiraceae bacterium CM]|nr:metal ABC transporter ATP-binding protein [Oscillospiraceae bacterium CM]
MVKAENLYFSYTGGEPYVLRGLNLVLNKGAYVSIVGDNGCGKSTLIRLILGLLKPTAGKLERQTVRIGYVPQKSDFLRAGFPITVYEMLDSYRRLLKIREKAVILESLERVGMAVHAQALMGNLSGGQSQKVLLARALMGSPALLVLDEPSTGVDPGSRREIYRLISGLNREKGLTVVSVEHNLVAAVANSTLIYHLDRGHGHMCTPAQFTAEFTNMNLDSWEGS